MVDVYLHGEIGEELGEKWTLDVGSASEALVAIEANTDKVIKFFSSDERLYQEYTVTVDEENIGEEEICTKKANKQIHIIPVIEGAKAAGKIVIGLALIAASFIPGLNVIAAKVLLAVGTSLVIGGITDLLSKPPKIGEATQTQSFLMGGNVNTAAQGQAVPIGYGRLRVGSQVISVSKRHRVKRSQGYEEALAASNERGWKEYVDNLIYSSSSVSFFSHSISA